MVLECLVSYGRAPTEPNGAIGAIHVEMHVAQPMLTLEPTRVVAHRRYCVIIGTAHHPTTTTTMMPTTTQVLLRLNRGPCVIVSKSTVSRETRCPTCVT